MSIFRSVYFLVLTVLVTFCFLPVVHAATPTTQQALVNWVVSATKEAVTPAQASRIVSSTMATAKRQQIDPLLILSVIFAESRFNVRAASRYGARGLMQVVPRWHRDKINKRNINDVQTNVEVGTQILEDCLVKHNDNLRKALRCYSGGASPIYHTRIAKAHQALKESVLALQLKQEEPVELIAKLDQPRYWHTRVSMPEFQAKRAEPDILLSFIANSNRRF